MVDNLLPPDMRQAIIDVFEDVLLEWEEDRKLAQNMLSPNEISYDEWSFDGRTMEYKQRLLDILSDIVDN